MAAVAEPAVSPDKVESEATKDQLDTGWVVICWNDPVNLMTYVTKAFQQVFGWSKDKASKHMMEVHNQGKSVLVRETMEKAEHYVHQLQKFSLHATMEKDRP